MSIRARLIFDLDGTLVESLPSLAAAGNALLRELGLPERAEAEFRPLIGRGARALVTDLLAGTSAAPDPALARFLEIYGADPVSRTTVFDGVPAALEGLARRHSLGIATQKPERAARDLLSALGLLPFFAAVTGGDTLNRLKPDPEMLHHTARALGPGPVIFIGDSRIDRDTARAAGCPFVLYTGGYRQETVEALSPDAVFDRHDALPGAVDALLTAG